MRHLLTLLARSLCALFYTQKPILYFIAKEQLEIFEVSSHDKTVSSRAWHTTVQNTSTSSIPASYRVVHSTTLTAISQEPLMLSKYVILINVIICNMAQVVSPHACQSFINEQLVIVNVTTGACGWGTPRFKAYRQ